MTGRSQIEPNTLGARGKRGKDDRKQNTLAPLVLCEMVFIHSNLSRLKETNANVLFLYGKTRIRTTKKLL
jgi:hypothetical protein